MSPPSLGGIGIVHCIRLPLLLTLLLLTTCHRPALAFCPSRCRCAEDSSLRIDCPSAALDVVPIQLNPDVRFINLTANHIQNVHFTLQFYYRLEVLDLSANHINTLGSKNFESQAQLLTLDLSRNLITHLNKDVFRGLRRLQTLRLAGNRIVGVHPAAMLDLVAMQRLDLSGNALVSLENGTMRNCQSLQELDLRQNELLDVPAENLRHVRGTLRWLDMSTNFVQTLANGSFEGMEALRRLDVSGNVLNEVEAWALAPLGKLQHLDLADNNITDIPTAQMAHLAQLAWLSLSGNGIKSLPALAFGSLFQLRELHLDRMDQMEDIDERAFLDNTLLATLSLDNNAAITSLPPHLFRNNPKLTDLRMRANSLETLADTHIPIDQLASLALGNNPFVCNCSLLWLWQLAAQQSGTDKASASETTKSTGPTVQPLVQPLVLVDRTNVSCHFPTTKTADGSQPHKFVPLASLHASDIECPASNLALTLACSLLAVAAVAAGAAGALRWRWKIRQAELHGSCVRERKHIMDAMIVPPGGPSPMHMSMHRPLPPIVEPVAQLPHEYQLQMHRQQQMEQLAEQQLQQQQLEAKMQYYDAYGNAEMLRQQHQYSGGGAVMPPLGTGTGRLPRSNAHSRHSQFDDDVHYRHRQQYEDHHPDDDPDEMDHYEQFDDYRYDYQQQQEQQHTNHRQQQLPARYDKKPPPGTVYV